MLIVIEGLDGSGKSTQVANVREYLTRRQGQEPEYLHFPRFDAPVVGAPAVRGRSLNTCIFPASTLLWSGT